MKYILRFKITLIIILLDVLLFILGYYVMGDNTLAIIICGVSGGLSPSPFIIFYYEYKYHER